MTSSGCGTSERTIIYEEENIQMLPLYLLLGLLYLINADIIVYNNHYLKPEVPEYLIIPKYGKKEVPNWSPGNGRSFIDLSRLTVRSACYQDLHSPYPPPPPPPVPFSKDQCKPVELDMLMFVAPTEKAWMDYWEDNDFCCTSDLIEDGLCSQSQRNSLIVPALLPGAFLRSTTVQPDEPTTLFQGEELTKHEVTSSGQYVLLMAVCDPNAAPVAIGGAIDSMDPYGYLPAEQFGNLPFYVALTCMYLIIGVVWMILCCWHWDQLLPLQIWISAVLAIAMTETTMLFSHFLDWNDAGVPATSITLIALIFGVTKRALSRVLVQLVALGYGVVRPSLGEDMTRVLYLGGAYFVLSLIYTLMTNLTGNSKSVGEPEYDLLSLVVFMLAVVDTTFYIWIFTSINNLMVSLAARKQGVKYVLYRNFRGVLITLLILTCVWALYGSALFLNDSNGTNKNWREKWTIDALWELIYFLIFAAIAVLWAPSNNSQRYAYSIELTQLEDDSEWNAAAAQAEEAEAAGDGELDDEYGGRLKDEKDPFQGTGALDPAAAFTKKA